MDHAGEWRVYVTDVDVRAARTALLDALEAGAPPSRVHELLLDWAQLAAAQDEQSEGPAPDA